MFSIPVKTEKIIKLLVSGIPKCGLPDLNMRSVFILIHSLSLSTIRYRRGFSSLDSHVIGTPCTKGSATIRWKCGEIDLCCTHEFRLLNGILIV